jgi:hypothetical protein
MKTLLCTITFLLCSHLLCSQTIDGKSLSEIDVTYIAIKVYCDRYRTFTLRVDYGQRVESLHRRDNNQVVRGENGAPLLFNSPMDALNFMYDFGYVYHDSQGTGTLSLLGEQNYILVKK